MQPHGKPPTFTAGRSRVDRAAEPAVPSTAAASDSAAGPTQPAVMQPHASIQQWGDDITGEMFEFVGQLPWLVGRHALMGRYKLSRSRSLSMVIAQAGSTAAASVQQFARSQSAPDQVGFTPACAVPACLWAIRTLGQSHLVACATLCACLLLLFCSSMSAKKAIRRREPTRIGRYACSCVTVRCFPASWRQPPLHPAWMANVPCSVTTETNVQR